MKLKNDRRVVRALNAVESNDFQWIMENCHIDSPFVVDISKSPVLLQQVVKYNYFDMLKWLVNDSGQQVNLAADENLVAREAARNGHLEILKWVVLESGQQVNLTDKSNLAVREAIEYGHLDTLKWLVHESGQNIDVTDANHLAFQFAALNGYLDIIQWLIIEYPEARHRQWELGIITEEQLESGQKIQISTDDDYAIRLAADHHHFEVCKWLINESWMYGVEVLSAEVALEVCSKLNLSLESECPDYVVLQSLIQFGQSSDEAVAQLLKFNTDTGRGISQSSRV